MKNFYRHGRVTLLLALIAASSVAVAQGVSGDPFAQGKAASKGNLGTSGGGNSARTGFGSRISLGLLPLTTFSLGGSFGAQGGTQSTFGGLASLSYQEPFSKRSTSMGVSAFTFLPYEQSQSDARLFGINANYLFSRRSGLQLGYLNLYNGSAPSATAHVLINIADGSFTSAPSPQASILDEQQKSSPYTLGKSWSVSLGLGTYFNFADDLVARQQGANTVLVGEKKTTVGLSTFIVATVEIDKSTSLVLTQWVFRDRNVDIGRFAVGFNWKF